MKSNYCNLKNRRIKKKMTPNFFKKKEIKELCKSSLANETVFELKTEKYNCKQSSSIAEPIPLQSKTIISHM